MGRRCRPVRPKLAIHPYRFALLALEILQDLDIHRTDQWEDPDRLQLTPGAIYMLQRAAEKYMQEFFTEAKLWAHVDQNRHEDILPRDLVLARRSLKVKLA